MCCWPFVLSVAKVTKCICAGLEAAGLSHSIETCPAAKFLGRDDDHLPILSRFASPGYVDDLAVPIVAPAGELCRKATAAFKVVHSAFLRFKFEVHLSPKKTAFLPLLVGKGSEVARQFIASLTDGCLIFENAIAGDLKLPEVASCKH